VLLRHRKYVVLLNLEDGIPCLAENDSAENPYEPRNSDSRDKKWVSA